MKAIYLASPLCRCARNSSMPSGNRRSPAFASRSQSCLVTARRHEDLLHFTSTPLDFRPGTETSQTTPCRRNTLHAAAPKRFTAGNHSHHATYLYFFWSLTPNRTARLCLPCSERNLPSLLKRVAFSIVSFHALLLHATAVIVPDNKTSVKLGQRSARSEG